MATYSSYKKVNGASFNDGALSDNNINANTLNNFGVKWFYGIPCRCSAGCCCNWTVPAQVKRLTWEVWGSGGNGAGACTCNRCHHFRGAGGGSFAQKTISTQPGCSYRVCASGVYRCLSRECVACNGCSSYVNGYNLSDFCACGGHRAETNTAWSDGCFYSRHLCLSPTTTGGDMALGGATQAFGSASGYCHCHNQEANQGSGMRMGNLGVSQGLRECWMKCGCWSVPYTAGGQSAQNTYCGRCCGQGGTGGGGLVRVTYI